MKFVRLNPMILQYEDVTLPRPQVCPFNIIKYNKIRVAGSVNGLLMVIFQDDKGQPEKTINWFRLVSPKLIKGIISGNHDACDKFIENALEGIYPVYIEESNNYFI